MLIKFDLYIDVDCSGASPEVVTDVTRRYTAILLQQLKVTDRKFNGKIGDAISKSTGGSCSGMTLLTKESAMEILFEGLKKSKNNKKKSDITINTGGLFKRKKK